MACDNCSEELITTSQGPQGEQGIQGIAGTNGTNGVLDWNQYDLSCWVSEGISDSEENPIITQQFIDAFCEVYQAVHVSPIAVNDYRTMNQDSIIYIEVINNDRFYPDVTVTIDVAPSNGTATIEADNKTIKYIPNTGFIGVDDFDYTINDGTSTSTATVSVTVQEVISQQTIQDTVLEQLQILLSSDDYWDLSFTVGDKIAIRNETLTHFDFSNPLTAGIGQGRYSKWAICNGNNGTEDHTNNTLRGFNHTDSDYDESAKTGGADTVTLSRDNIPPHKHTAGFFYSEFEPDSGNYAKDNFNDSNLIPGLSDITVGGAIQNTHQNMGVGSGDMEYHELGYNTGDGTQNFADNKELKASPDAVDIRNAYRVIILIQKIA